MLDKAEKMYHTENDENVCVKQIEIYKQVLQLDKDNIEALTNISDCYIHLKLNNEAKPYAKRAYEICKCPITAVNYSCTLNTEEAIKILEEQKANDTSEPLVYNNLGYDYFLTEQYAKALDNYNISIILEEKNPLAYSNRGILRYFIFNDTKNGLEDLKKAHKYGDFEASMILQNIEKEKHLLS